MIKYFALLHLIALGKDTNMIKRGGIELAQKTSNKIKELLKNNPFPSVQIVRVQ